MNKQATIRVAGSVGPGVAENMMSGTVIVEGDASQYAGATGHGGLLVIKGNAASRCGISMKGIDIVVHGQYRAHVGLHGAGGQPGRLRRCGRGAGRHSLYEARLFVRGKVKSLGADCVEKEMRPEHLELLADLLERAGVRREAGGVPPLRLGPQALQFPHRQRLLRTGDDDRMSDAIFPAPLPIQSATFSNAVNAEIRRAAATGIYDIRGGGAKRRVPHFDDLLFLGASVSPLSAGRLPRDLRHECHPRHAFREEPHRARHPDHHRRHELRRAVRARRRRRWGAARRWPGPRPPPATAA
jgi:hypothetical protein